MLIPTPEPKSVATPSKRLMPCPCLLYEMITVCLLHPLTTSTVSHRFIPGGTLGTGFCVPAPVESDDATGVSVEGLVEEFVTASLLSIVRASGNEVLERRSEEADVWFARGTALLWDIGVSCGSCFFSFVSVLALSLGLQRWGSTTVMRIRERLGED